MATGNNTDYGNLYTKTPSAIEQPKDLAELAAALKKYNDRGTPVRIRNTAHSTNGQTVTDGPQIHLGGLTGAKFDREKMTVTAGAGTPWADVLTAIGFPQFCLPLFPNNPGQRIRIGGTAAVGGVGFYGSTVGGFWNAVQSIELVTMTGERLTCSRTQNPDYFFYSMGGFSRLGVMGEVTVKVVDSKPFVIGAILLYRDLDAFIADFERARTDPYFNGVSGQEDISSGIPKRAPDESFTAEITTKLDLKLLIVIKEVADTQQAVLDEFDRHVKTKYHGGVVMYMDLRASNINTRFEPMAFPKRELVYFYPAAQSFWRNLLDCFCDMLIGRRPFQAMAPAEDPNLLHPWNDCIVPRETYNDFMKEAKRIITRFGLKRTISKQSVFHGLLNLDSFVTFVIKKHPTDVFPVALDLADEPEAALGLAIMPDVTASQRKEALAMDDELTNLCYAMKGRRYLYGYHDLTREQVVQHYGADVIAKWNKLKREVDPKRLLNVGVVEHLDDM